MIDLAETTARDLARRVGQGEWKAVEVTQAALDRIEQLDKHFQCFITVARQQALEAAAEVDRQVAEGKRLPLAGVPLAVKDGFWTKGLRTTGGTAALADFVPSADATAVARLKAAGCVVIGKASMHEMAFGFTGANPHFGDCRNPWDRARIPGGSSSGSAVALATSMALAAIGGDTGGSIRLPAALCSVVGLKVTYGRVSRYGGVPLSWSMDTVGPMARNVADAATLLQAMAGLDPLDATASARPVPDYAAELEKPIAGLRLGIPHAHFFEPLEPEVAAALQDALHLLGKLGARLVDVTLPPIEPVRAAHRAIIFCEAAQAHQELVRTRGAKLHEDIRPLLQVGLFLPASLYLKAQQVRRVLVDAHRQAWSACDVVVAPTSPISAVPFGATTTRLAGKDVPLVQAFLDHTLPFNLTGQPAVSIPCGFTKAGLPIGMQLIGRPFDEALLLRLAAAYERATPWHARKPALPPA